MIDFLIRSIAAGAMIAIACVISLTLGNLIASPILFSIGLLLICYRGYNLYTGKVGYIKSKTDFGNIWIILAGNMIGVIIVSLVKHIDTTAMIITKMSNPWYLTFINAVFCGWLMYVAVDTFKKGTPIGIICAVPAFIICGFEHSIADMYYFFNGQITVSTMFTLLLIIVGNAVGANLHRLTKE